MKECQERSDSKKTEKRGNRPDTVQKLWNQNRKKKKRRDGALMRHHNAASQQHPACSSLPAVYLIATPSFCLLSSLSVSPFLRHSLPHPWPAQADGDCKARWRIPASQSVSACCSPIQGKRPECFPHCAPHMHRFSLCQCQGNINQRNGSEWQHVNRDRQREIGE